MTLIDIDLDERRREVADRLARLRAERPPLAWKAERGEGGAADELARVEAAIAAAERDGERLDLVAEEATWRANEERRRAEQERRRWLEEERAAAIGRRMVAYRQVEAALVGLAVPIAEALAAGRELDRLAGELGRPSTIVPNSAQVGQALAARSLHVLSEAGLRPLLPGTGGRGIAPLAETESEVAS